MRTGVPRNRLLLLGSVLTLGLLGAASQGTAAPDDPYAPPPPPAYDDEWSAPETEPPAPSPQDRWTTPPEQLGPDAGLQADATGSPTAVDDATAAIEAARSAGFDITGGMTGPGPAEPRERTQTFPGRGRAGGGQALGPTARIFEVTVRHGVVLEGGPRGVELEIAFTARGLGGLPVVVGVWMRDAATDLRLPAAAVGYADGDGRLTAQSVRFVVEAEGARHLATLRIPYGAIPRRLGALTYAVTLEAQVLAASSAGLVPLATGRLPVTFAGSAGTARPTFALPGERPVSVDVPADTDPAPACPPGALGAALRDLQLPAFPAPRPVTPRIAPQRTPPPSPAAAEPPPESTLPTELPPPVVRKVS
ncbi:MAG: hypothetical protein AB7T63_15900 [Planctomycetota bacterium]